MYYLHDYRPRSSLDLYHEYLLAASESVMAGNGAYLPHVAERDAVRWPVSLSRAQGYPWKVMIRLVNIDVWAELRRVKCLLEANLPLHTYC